MPGNYILLERIELNASTASITFANIPQTGYTDLKIVASARGTANTVWSDISLLFNGASTNFSAKMLYTTGTSVASDPITNTIRIPGPSATASTFGNLEIYVSNYTSSNYKSWSADTVNENNSSSASVILNSLIAGLWSNTAAITSVSLSADSGNLVQYSTFSLYGLAATGTTPAIAPKASGGNVIATDGTYWYHAFLASGTFTPQVGLSCDVLQVAGGGGASGGGGGAGGLLYSTAQSISTATTVTVGAGGAGAVSNGSPSPNASNGSNSVFGSLTATGGGGGGGVNAALKAGSGGSGGGAGAVDGTPGDGTLGQGNNGGTLGGNTGANYPSGGGGGAGAVGGNATGGLAPGTGGNGVNTYSSWASTTGTGANSGYYAGGGGGGVYNSSSTPTGAAGGLGGGGRGSQGSGSNTLGLAGTINTGGGAGGGNAAGLPSGGSGIVIIRYTIA